jgi:hypothetical protein
VNCQNYAQPCDMVEHGKVRPVLAEVELDGDIPSPWSGGYRIAHCSGHRMCLNVVQPSDRCAVDITCTSTDALASQKKCRLRSA